MLITIINYLTTFMSHCAIILYVIRAAIYFNLEKRNRDNKDTLNILKNWRIIFYSIYVLLIICNCINKYYLGDKYFNFFGAVISCFFFGITIISTIFYYFILFILNLK